MEGLKKQLGAAMLAKRTRKRTNGNSETEKLGKSIINPACLSRLAWKGSLMS